MMTDIERMTLNQRIADGLDRAGLGVYTWEPARTCPQGHAQPDAQIGDLCYECSGSNASNEEYYPERAEEFAAHPEWRIGRVARDFTQPNNLWPAVEAWLRRNPSWDLQVSWNGQYPGWLCRLAQYDMHNWAIQDAWAAKATLAEAVMTAWIDILPTAKAGGFRPSRAGFPASSRHRF